MSRKIRVLIVDDSALVRQVLSEILAGDPAIEVVGTAQDPYIARDKIKQLNPDVLTLDVEMPRMDGVTFLRNLMRLRPMPVVMISSLTEKGADITLEALELGAIDFVAKPKLDVATGLEEYAREICEKVRLAAEVPVRALGERSSHQAVTPAAPLSTTGSDKSHLKTTEGIIAIGASTGGTEAIRVVLEQLPPDAPGIVISQHIPAAFSRPFAERMHRSSALTVYEASDGQQILPGHVYIAPGDDHLTVERSGARYLCRLDRSAPVNRHRPSVDVMFRSVATQVGANAMGVLLTGMGEDGARGLLEMRQAGAITLAQDEKTSVVWGMPGTAVELGAASFVLPLPQIAGKLMTLARERHSGKL